MGGENTLAVCINAFRQLADGDFLGIGGSGEGEGFEAAGFVVTRTILQRSTCRQRPDDMHPTGKHPQHPSIVKGDGNQHVVRRNTGLKELKQAVFGGFDGSDVTRQASKLFAEFLTCFPKNPPLFPIGGTGIMVTLRFDPFKNALIHLRIVFAYLVCRQAEQVYHLHPARPVGQIPAVTVILDWGIRFKSGYFFRGDNEACTMQLEAR